MNKILYPTILLVLFLTACSSEKKCQCTTILSNGTMVVQEPYTINVGECSDSDSDLEGIKVECLEIK